MYCSVTPQYHPSRQNRIHVVGQDPEEGIKKWFRTLFFAPTLLHIHTWIDALQ